MSPGPPTFVSRPMQIAVIGAGLAGLTAAHELDAAGESVVVFEKSRGVGGRTATRRGPDGLRFDHGAPFLHDGTDLLGGLRDIAAHDLVFPDGTTRHESVGVPTANGVAKGLAADLDVQTAVRVEALAPDGRGWKLVDEAGARLGSFDAVVVTAPAPQAAELLQQPAPELADRVRGVTFSPCWSAMIAWEQPLGLPFTAVRDAGGWVWAVAEPPKPGRSDVECWVLQADPAWSTAHLEDSPESVAGQLLDRFAAAAGRALARPAHLAAHRWRYARPATPLPDLFLQEGTLLAAGDWCGGTTAGAALRSGRAAAAALLS